MKEEKWYDIKDTNLYKISNIGNIKRIYEVKKTEKILKQFEVGNYLCINICKNGIRRHKMIHRIIAETFIPNPDNKPFVNHIDGNKFNNNISNLEWVTQSENSQHAYKTGLMENVYIALEKRYNKKLTRPYIV